MCRYSKIQNELQKNLVVSFLEKQAEKEPCVSHKSKPLVLQHIFQNRKQ